MSEPSEEGEVVIHEASVLENVTAESAKRKFARSGGLPIRVRDGGFEEEYLLAGNEKVPWDSIYFVALGIIDQMVKDSELKAGALRKMVKKVTAGGSGNEKGNAKDRAKVTRELYLFDVFSEVQEQPFRFAAGNIHYKTFLDKVGYVSHHNFYRFCVQFLRHLPEEVRVTTSLGAFMAKDRMRLAHFPDYHDFELEVSQQIRGERDVITLSEVDLSRDSWVEEWSDDDF